MQWQELGLHRLVVCDGGDCAVVAAGGRWVVVMGRQY